MSTTVKHEIRRLSTLAAPVVATQVATMLLGVVDTLMVGHVSVDVLGAASLGHVWTFGTLIFAMGIVYGMDPVITQAHGAGDSGRVARTLQRGIVVGLLVSVPLALLWSMTEPVMRMLGQDPELARMTRTYTMVQIPSIPCFMVFTALRQYLQGRGVVIPTLLVAVVANGINVILNYGLIFGHWGLPELGLVGAGMATGGTRIFMFVALLWVIRARQLHAGAWVPWTGAVLRWRGLKELFHFGLPVGFQFALEVWAFQITTLLAGDLGKLELGAHTIVLNMASLSFMVPLGLSLAAVTRVGNLTGAGDRLGAQRAAWVAFGMGALVMTVFATVFLTFRHQLPRMFTDDPGVIALAASILPIAGAFQLFDGTQVVGGGILRGLGATRPAAVFNLVGYYVLALPLAIWLTYGLDMGLPGLWWGLCLGLGAVALMLLAWVKRRGPARDGWTPVQMEATDG